MVSFLGDVEGTSQGTKVIKNIPTFKTEHWNIIELKPFRKDFSNFQIGLFYVLVAPSRIELLSKV